MMKESAVLDRYAKKHDEDLRSAAHYFLSKHPIIQDAKLIPLGQPRSCVPTGVANFRLPSGTPAFLVAPGFGAGFDALVTGGGDSPVSKMVVLVLPISGLGQSVLKPFHNGQDCIYGNVIFPIDSSGDYKSVEFPCSGLGVSYGVQTTAAALAGTAFTCAAGGFLNGLSQLTVNRSEIWTPNGAYNHALGPCTQANLIPRREFIELVRPPINVGVPQPLDTSAYPLYLSILPTTNVSTVAGTWGSNYAQGTGGGLALGTVLTFVLNRLNQSWTSNTPYNAPFIGNAFTPTRCNLRINMDLVLGCIGAAGNVNLGGSLVVQFKVPYVDTAGATQLQIFSLTKSWAVTGLGTDAMSAGGSRMATPVFTEVDFLIPQFCTEISFTFAAGANASAVLPYAYNETMFGFTFDGFAPTLRPAVVASGLSTSSTVTLNPWAVYATEPTSTTALMLGVNPVNPAAGELMTEVESMMPQSAQAGGISRADSAVEVPTSAVMNSEKLPVVTQVHPSGTFLAGLAPMLPAIAGAAGSILPFVSDLLKKKEPSQDPSTTKPALQQMIMSSIRTIVQPMVQDMVDRAIAGLRGNTGTAAVHLPSETTTYALKQGDKYLVDATLDNGKLTVPNSSMYLLREGARTYTTEEQERRKAKALSKKEKKRIAAGQQLPSGKVMTVLIEKPAPNTTAPTVYIVDGRPWPSGKHTISVDKDKQTAVIDGDEYRFVFTVGTPYDGEVIIDSSQLTSSIVTPFVSSTGTNHRREVKMFNARNARKQAVADTFDYLESPGSNTKKTIRKVPNDFILASVNETLPASQFGPSFALFGPHVFEGSRCSVDFPAALGIGVVELGTPTEMDTSPYTAGGYCTLRGAPVSKGVRMADQVTTIWMITATPRPVHYISPSAMATYGLAGRIPEAYEYEYVPVWSGVLEVLVDKRLFDSLTDDCKSVIAETCASNFTEETLVKSVYLTSFCSADRTERKTGDTDDGNFETHLHVSEGGSLTATLMSALGQAAFPAAYLAMSQQWGDILRKKHRKFKGLPYVMLSGTPATSGAATFVTHVKSKIDGYTAMLSHILRRMSTRGFHNDWEHNVDIHFPGLSLTSNGIPGGVSFVNGIVPGKNIDLAKYVLDTVNYGPLV